MNYWWVNQGKTYSEERKGEYIWAPDDEYFHHQNMKKITEGDEIFHYSDGAIRAISHAVEEPKESNDPHKKADWNKKGIMVFCQYEEIEQPIKISQIGKMLSDLKMEKSPINSSGGVNQGYIYSINSYAADLILKAKEENERKMNVLIPALK